MTAPNSPSFNAVSQIKNSMSKPLFKNAYFQNKPLSRYNSGAEALNNFLSMSQHQGTSICNKKGTSSKQKYREPGSQKQVQLPVLKSHNYANRLQSEQTRSFQRIDPHLKIQVDKRIQNMTPLYSKSAATSIHQKNEENQPHKKQHAIGTLGIQNQEPSLKKSQLKGPFKLRVQDFEEINASYWKKRYDTLEQRLSIKFD